MREIITRDILLNRELSKYRKYCKCGHSVIMPDGTNVSKIICTFCGRYIYKNDKEKFKELIIKEMRRNGN